MKGLLLKEWYTFRLLFILIAAAALVMPLFFTNKCFYFYYMLALMIGMYPLLSAADDEKSRYDSYLRTMPLKETARADVYYLTTLLLTGILLLSVCCIPQESRFGFYRNAAGSLQFCRVSLPEGEFAFMTLMTKPQMVWTMGSAALLMPALYLPVMFRFGQRAGILAAFAGLILCLAYLTYYRGCAMTGRRLMQDEVLYLAVSMVIAAGFAVSRFLSEAACLKRSLPA